MTDECEIPQRNQQRDDDIQDGLAHLCSARTLNAREPVEEPQADGERDVENHLPDLNLEIAVRGLRRHCFSSISGDEARMMCREVFLTGVGREC